MIKPGKPQPERLVLLHALAVQQMRTLNKITMSNLPLLPEGEPK